MDERCTWRRILLALVERDENDLYKTDAADPLETEGVAIRVAAGIRTPGCVTNS